MRGTASIKPPFFHEKFFRSGAHSQFSPWRETHRFSPGSGSVEATRLHSAKARLAAELTFHSSVWQMINWDYRPVELGLAKAVIYAGLSHPEHGGKGSETRRIPRSEGAKHHPPGWSRAGADGEKGDVPPPPCDSQFCRFSRQNAAAKQPQAGPRSPGAAVHGRGARQEPARGDWGVPSWSWGAAPRPRSRPAKPQ